MKRRSFIKGLIAAATALSITAIRRPKAKPTVDIGYNEDRVTGERIDFIKDVQEAKAKLNFGISDKETGIVIQKLPSFTAITGGYPVINKSAEIGNREFKRERISYTI